MAFVNNISIKNISAGNLQNNWTSQGSVQGAKAKTWWGSAKAKNANVQGNGSTQVGSANNNLNVSSNAWLNNIGIKNVDATNIQNNTTNQGNWQSASATGGWSASASNGSWQSNGNYQSGSANNNINIWA